MNNNKLLAKFGGRFDGTKSYVYRISNFVNIKLYYGKTNDPAQRWYEHKSSAKHGSVYPIHNAMRKHGTNIFTFEVIEELSTEQEALDREV